jgi:tetratricopeptide (TPR) repeat protein
MKRILSIILLLSGLISTPVFAGEDARLYLMAVKAAREKNFDFAFMRFRAIALEYPRSRYREKALFSQGEYYFQLPNLQESAKSFQEFIKNYPNANAKLFALAHLLKIAEIQQHKEIYDEIAKEIISLKQVSLIFRDFKEYSYKSPLNRKYRAVFHIDTIEFFVEGQLFAKISF